MNIPEIHVGIMSAPALRLTLSGHFSCGDSSHVTGTVQLTESDGKVLYGGNTSEHLTFTPLSPECTVTLHDVTIGLEFHWQRHEDQTFRGAMHIFPVGNRLQAVNIIDIESYLTSVVSSEMNARACTEFIKAHAIISRSWLMAQLHPDNSLSRHRCSETDSEIVRWYDREAHSLYHVCADDHCQRYQGYQKASSPHVADAVAATAGMVLWHDGLLCDARFSKCCGGVTERFSTCWQPVDYPYLEAVTDTLCHMPHPDLAEEKGAAEWIGSHPDTFCSDPPREVLSTVLNDYDLETPDFYRWQVEYSDEELAGIIRSRTGKDFGRILSLTPLHRGLSGRIDRLEIKGTRLSMTIGKELEIRRSLSPTHLYSSAFTVHPSDYDPQGAPLRWLLRGAGWGHGVGLCQIGAAVMAHRGDRKSVV